MSKIAVVTGAGKGIGREVSRALARRGLDVLATDIDLAAAEATADGIGWAVEHDVREPDGHRRVAEAARARGDVEVWVNNAGVLRVGPAWETSEAEVRSMVDINLLGVIWGSQAAVSVMRSGHIVNICSLSALAPAPGLAVYAATKHAVLGFSTAMAGDLRRAHIPIHVTALCPDAVATDMVSGVSSHQASDILFSARHMLTAADVAGAVLTCLDHPRLVRIIPPVRGALAQALRPFPGFGLRVLERFAALGARHKAARAHD